MPASDSAPRLGKALLTLAAWLLATIVVGALLRPEVSGSTDQIVEALAAGPMWNVVAGLAILTLATRAFGWRDLGFGWPNGRAVLRLIWFPVLTLLPFYGIALAIGLPSRSAVLVLALNTTLVALSEEWMFRGVLFQALRSRLRIWPAIALSSALFGAVHVLNAFALGNFALAAAQAVAASMTGLLLVALRLRTGSIWPAVAYHMVWNFGILLVAYETAKFPEPDAPLEPSAFLVPLLIVLPNFLYGLILLRMVRSSGPDGGRGGQG